MAQSDTNAVGLFVTLFMAGVVPIMGGVVAYLRYRLEQERHKTAKAQAERKQIEDESEARLRQAEAEAARKNAESQALIIRVTTEAQNAVNIGKQLTQQNDIIREAFERHSDDTRRATDQRTQDAERVTASIDSNTAAVKRLETDIEGIARSVNDAHAQIDALPRLLIKSVVDPLSGTMTSIYGAITVLSSNIDKITQEMQTIVPHIQRDALPPQPTLTPQPDKDQTP